MKRITLFLVTLFLTYTIKAQDCVPAEGLPDTLVGVVPLPYDSILNPTGGIGDTACLNTYYEFTFTIVVPPEFDSPIGPVPINSIEFATEGALMNIPDEFDYICSPPDCIFLKDSIGCVKLFGTPDDPEDEGVWDMEIAGKIRSVLDFDLTFPDPNLFPGNYFLHIQPEGSANCFTVGTEELASTVRMVNAPNPFSSFTQILINAETADNYTFRVHDLMGKEMHSEKVRIFEGSNTLDFNGSSLASGVYIYSISNGKAVVSKKMIVNRR